MPVKGRTVYLCAGLQGSGTTPISWCFLQRADLDGVLDARSDILIAPTIPEGSTNTWIKTTVSSFRMSEQIAHFEDFGWTVKPLLVCRDVRCVYSSLRAKEYGRNGTTAEDPPLRMRFRRFLQDWELFHTNGWPMIRFEEFLSEPERTLRATCEQLDLPWDDGVISWPKKPSAIWDPRCWNQTFRQTRRSTLALTVASNGAPAESQAQLMIPAAELAWLETTFQCYNQTNGYPTHISTHTPSTQSRDVPDYSVTRRFQRRRRKSVLRYLSYRLEKWLKPKADGSAEMR